MEPWQLAISILGIVLTGGIALVGSVWAVATIKSDNKANRESTRGLATQVGRLADAMTRIDDKVDDHGQRIARLEGGRGVV